MHADGFGIGNPTASAYFAPMSKVTNMNQFRKQKARADRKAQAETNTVKFGRTKAEKQRDKAKADKAIRHLDAHKHNDP